MLNSLAVVSDEQAAAARAAGATDADLDLIARLKARAHDFELARQELQRMGAAIARTNDTALLMEYGRLVERSDRIKSQISAATSAIDKAVSWARAALGELSAPELGALGVVWLLPGAVILAALAVIGYWLTDYRKFALRFNEQTRIASELVAGGMAPGAANIEAGRAVAATAPGMFGLGNFATLAAIIGLAVFAFASMRR